MASDQRSERNELQGAVDSLERRNGDLHRTNDELSEENGELRERLEELATDVSSTTASQGPTDPGGPAASEPVGATYDRDFAVPNFEGSYASFFLDDGTIEEGRGTADLHYEREGDRFVLSTAAADLSTDVPSGTPTRSLCDDAVATRPSAEPVVTFVPGDRICVREAFHSGTAMPEVLAPPTSDGTFGLRIVYWS